METGSAKTAEATVRPVTLGEVAALRRAGVIDSGHYLDAAYVCRDVDYWRRWSANALLALGVGHLLAGIVFFFAYNWDDLPTFGKFAVLEAGIVIAVVAALVARLERPAGQALLIGATVLTGTLLAVMSQVYQTGADDWQTFTMWALLTAPWALASRSAPHWLVWLVIALTAGNLYGYQVLLLDDVFELTLLSSLTAIAVGLVLAAREAIVFAGTDWLAPNWTRLVLVFAALLIVFPGAVGYVFGDDEHLVAAITFSILFVIAGGVYLLLLTDFAAIATAIGFGSLYLMAVGGRIVDETLGFNWQNAPQALFSMAILTLWCAGVTTATVKVLLALRRRM